MCSKKLRHICCSWVVIGGSAFILGGSGYTRFIESSIGYLPSDNMFATGCRA